MKKGQKIGLFVGASCVVAVVVSRRLKRKRKRIGENEQAVEAKEDGVEPSNVMMPGRGSKDTLGYWGMVSSSQKYASVAGIEILKGGGNAIDAAIGMAAVLCVTEPGSTDLGGDCFALIFDEGYVLGVNGSGSSSRHSTRERIMQDLDLNKSSETIEPAALNGHNVTTPGCVQAWCDMHTHFGKVPLRQILQPAIRLARYGFVLGDKAQRAVDECAQHAPDFIDSILKKKETIVTRPEMAQVLQEISLYGGHKAFYQGKTAKAIEYTVKQAGGCLDAQDLGRHRTEFTRPISTHFFGLTVWEHAPNCAGIVVLVALNVLTKLDFKSHTKEEAERMHLMIEALRWSFYLSRKYVGQDPAPISFLLSDETAAYLAKEISLETATAHTKITSLEAKTEPKDFGLRFGGSDTVSFQVIDSQGQSVSFVNSTYQSFGSKLSARGFSLQNRGHNFTTIPQHLNCVAPQKKPYHTIMPCLITRPSDGALLATLTNMGGFMQPSGHLQHIVNLFLLGLSPQASVDAPRFCLKNTDKPFGAMDAAVYLEPFFHPDTIRSLQHDFGHSIHLLPDNDPFTCGKTVGKAQIVLRDPESGLLRAGSDPRADGIALASDCPSSSSSSSSSSYC